MPEKSSSIWCGKIMPLFIRNRYYKSGFFSGLERFSYHPLMLYKAVRLRTNQLAEWDDFRTFDYYNEMQYPELLLEESGKLLMVC